MAQSSSASLLSETSIQKLIVEVEKRPALYNKNLKEYSDINLKKKLWTEVCEAIVDNWTQLSAEEKTKQGGELRKRWANLRTCFRRELNAQKNTKSGQSAAKRRKYIYFEQLLFLLPCMQNRRTEGNLKEDDSQDNTEDDVESGPSTSEPPRQRKKKIAKKTNLDGALLQALHETNATSNNVDEDTNFALSLVPSLQNFTAEEKLDAKIGVRNVIKEILARRIPTSSRLVTNSILQQPLSSFPIYYRSNNNFSRPQPQQTHTNCSTPSPSFQHIENVVSPQYSDTAQSNVSNFSEDSEMIYEL